MVWLRVVQTKRYDWNYVTLVRQLIEVTPAQLRVWIRLILFQSIDVKIRGVMVKVSA